MSVKTCRKNICRGLLFNQLEKTGFFENLLTLQLDITLTIMYQSWDCSVFTFIHSPKLQMKYVCIRYGTIVIGSFSFYQIWDIHAWLFEAIKVLQKNRTVLLPGLCVFITSVSGGELAVPHVRGIFI
jgi:hypothetical protein